MTGKTRRSIRHLTALQFCCRKITSPSNTAELVRWALKGKNYMDPHKLLRKYFGFCIFEIVALLVALHIPGIVFAESKDNSATSTETVNILHPEHIKVLKENSNTLQEVAAQLKGINHIIEGKLTDIGRNTNISGDIGNLNQSIAKLPDAIEDASPGFFSSLFGWIFQIIAIAVGAGVAIFVMDKQVKASWSQFLANQFQLQASAEENSKESWQQLLYSLGVKEKLQNERTERESEDKLRENEKVQNALKIGLQIYVGVLSDYAGLAVSRLESISENVNEASTSLASIELPSPPPGLWENLHSYTNVTSDASSMAIVASHLYGLGKHYCELQKQIVITKFEGIEKARKEDKDQKAKAAIEELKEYKRNLIEYFKDIQSVCENARSEFE